MTRNNSHQSWLGNDRRAPIMPKKTKYPVMLSFRADQLLKEAIVKVADDLDVNQADIFRKALRSYLLRVDALKQPHDLLNVV